MKKPFCQCLAVFALFCQGLATAVPAAAQAAPALYWFEADGTNAIVAPCSGTLTFGYNYFGTNGAYRSWSGVEIVRRKKVKEEVAETNATVETSFVVEWTDGSETNETVFASLANAQRQFEMLSADTNLSVSLGTNFTTNVFGIVTNWVERWVPFATLTIPTNQGGPPQTMVFEGDTFRYHTLPEDPHRMVFQLNQQ